MLTTESQNLIAYWPLAEPAGISGADSVKDVSGNSRNATPTGVTFGEVGFGGKSAASLDGSTSLINIHSAGLAAAFNGAEGSAALWLSASDSGVWSDAAYRGLLRIIAATGANQVFVYREASVNGRITVEYDAGGTTKGVGVTGLSGTNWIHLALTWSKAADQFNVYINGAQFGSTLTGLGTFSGSPTSQVVGASSTTPTQVWSGKLAHVALWSKPLTASQIADLARN